MINFRELCNELLDELKYQTDWSIAEELKARASAALDESEPEITHDGSSNKPTAKELQSLWKACNNPRVFAHAVLARWGNHPGSPDSSMPQPVPVSERLPGPEDCDAEGECYWFGPEGSGAWYQDTYQGNYTHWLPNHALPSSGEGEA